MHFFEENSSPPELPARKLQHWDELPLFLRQKANTVLEEIRKTLTQLGYDDLSTFAQAIESGAVEVERAQQILGMVTVLKEVITQRPVMWSGVEKMDNMLSPAPIIDVAVTQFGDVILVSGERVYRADRRSGALKELTEMDPPLGRQSIISVSSGGKVILWRSVQKSNGDIAEGVNDSILIVDMYSGTVARQLFDDGTEGAITYDDQARSVIRTTSKFLGNSTTTALQVDTLAIEPVEVAGGGQDCKISRIFREYIFYKKRSTNRLWVRDTVKSTDVELGNVRASFSGSDSVYLVVIQDLREQLHRYFPETGTRRVVFEQPSFIIDQVLENPFNPAEVLIKGHLFDESTDLYVVNVLKQKTVWKHRIRQVLDSKGFPIFDVSAAFLPQRGLVIVKGDNEILFFGEHTNQ